MAIEDLGVDEIAALCRRVLSADEVKALDQTIMAEAMTELSRMRRSGVAYAPPTDAGPDDQPFKPLAARKIKLVKV
jgi:hypothetical protein